MRIGYACINTSIGCTANSTFRLRNYSKENMIEKISNNLTCLKKILEWNVKKGIFFFRMSSDIVPFASHPVCKFDWKKHFKKELEEIGTFINKNKIRVSMHPDQFVIINAKDPGIVERSVKELEYHCNFLDLMKVKGIVQIHVGGVYGDKEESMKRFVANYKKLPLKIRRRLCIENDHRSYSFKDCMYIHKKTKIPIVFDVYHHECLNNGEEVIRCISDASKTWKEKLIVHYSNEGEKKGSHSQHINIRLFNKFLKEIKGLDFDIMLEVKDKEKSALKANKLIK